MAYAGEFWLIVRAMQDNNFSLTGQPASATLECPIPPPQRILVVEDEMDIRELITDALRHSGYRVDTAKDGSAAWDILQVNRYDLMVTDNRMPKVTGVELLKKVRIARLPLPVIMATGAFPETDFARFPMLQPAATLLKPYTIAELLRTVKKVLREAESPDASSKFLTTEDYGISNEGEDDTDLEDSSPDSAGPDRTFA